MIEYPKVYGPYKRHTEGPERNKLIIGEWYRPEFAVLSNATWVWGEKIDGTNIRIGWDGHKVTIGGRTDNAQLHSELVGYLNHVFVEELFEQSFGSDPVILFGEGCGPGIQKGGDRYGEFKHFKLFDVQVGDWWLQSDDISDVADKLGIERAKVRLVGTPYNAIELVSNGMLSAYGDFEPEGLVGVPQFGLLDRSGRRIQMKVKACDFHKEVAAA
jgi:hypothetical protein